MKGINRTLPMTIPIPVSAVPKKRKNEPPKTRITVPTPIIINPKSIALALPSFLPIAEEKREKVAKVSRGKVVRNPAHALERSRSSLMRGINGPTAVIEGLRLKEIRMIPKIKSGVPGFFC